jgi:predicted glycogen debranching enzyme
VFESLEAAKKMSAKSFAKSRLPRSTGAMISFDRHTCADWNEAAAREWLETNGIGGFASSSITGANRRRYHALLIAATKPPVGRCVLLSKLEETILIGGRRIEISTNEYAGALHPRGFEYLKSFRLAPFPIFTFEVDGIEIEKCVFMVYGSNATVVQYRLLNAALGELVRLEVRPLVAFRDYHATTHANDHIQRVVIQESNLISYSAYVGVPTLHLAHNAASVEQTGHWYYNFRYELERERGLDFNEDLFNPVALTFSLQRSASASLIAATEPSAIEEADTLREQEILRREELLTASPIEDPFAIALTGAADQFLTRRGEGWTVLAGYPWFTDWGRDTMIALPGLTLYTGRSNITRSVLKNFSYFVDRGMLPNRFPDDGEAPEYNTADATLWFFETVRSYVDFTGDLEFARELYPVLRDIIHWHIRGTRYGIKVLDNGLLHAGEPGVQLTWMDAKIGEWVVTSRSGQPVEIQALWYNSLKIMEVLAHRLGRSDDQDQFRTMSSRLESTFHRLFWNEAEGCLYDVVCANATDASIRPNQIFAVSLHHPLVTGDRANSILDVAQRELLTPYGLRTLSPRDANYHGRYDGDMRSRDSAYHQGTVWPWLLGPFFSAYVKVHGRTEAVQTQLLAWLEPLQRHLCEAGLGQISEVFDGDPPHRPGGSFAQAWSVAEVLRTLCEEVYEITLQRSSKSQAKRQPN